ncbi:hypothetical protein CMV_016371, partial [Castanea mollissima]
GHQPPRRLKPPLRLPKNHSSGAAAAAAWAFRKPKIPVRLWSQFSTHSIARLSQTQTEFRHLFLSVGVIDKWTRTTAPTETATEVAGELFLRRGGGGGGLGF